MGIGSKVGVGTDKPVGNKLGCGESASTGASDGVRIGVYGINEGGTVTFFVPLLLLALPVRLKDILLVVELALPVPLPLPLPLPQAQHISFEEKPLSS